MSSFYDFPWHTLTLGHNKLVNSQGEVLIVEVLRKTGPSSYDVLIPLTGTEAPELQIEGGW